MIIHLIAWADSEIHKEGLFFMKCVHNDNVPFRIDIIWQGIGVELAKRATLDWPLPYLNHTHVVAKFMKRYIMKPHPL